MTSLYDPKIHLPSKPDFSNPRNNYEPATPLGEEIMKYIGVIGAPITLAEYMERCLRDEEYGYYTNPPLRPSSSSHSGTRTSKSIQDGPMQDIIHNNNSNNIDDDDDDDDEFHDEFDSLDTMEEERGNDRGRGRGHWLIGKAGDFTTAPEISQIFGECVTIWLLTQYEALGKPSRIQLVELGPGRGTLMCDVLRSARGINGPGEDFIRALAGGGGGGGGNSHGVHFVEISENLRITQREALQKMQDDERQGQGQGQGQGIPGLWSFDFIPWKSRDETQRQVEEFVTKLKQVKASQGGDITVETLSTLMEEKQKHQQKEKQQQQSSGHLGAIKQTHESDDSFLSTIPVHWHSSLDSVPWKRNVYLSTNGEDGEPIPTFIIGQEFFDALPVHVFQKTQNGWREQMVDVAMEDDDDDSDDDDDEKEQGTKEKEQEATKVIVQMRDGTFAKTKAPSSKTTTTLPQQQQQQQQPNAKAWKNGKKKPRFRHVLSPGITPALRALLHLDDDGNPTGTKEQIDTLNNAPVGTILEVCPEGLALVQDIALRIEACRGAAIIFDYGNDGSRDTMRAFRKHEQVDVLSSPGTVDITADVDFGALKNAVNIDLRVMGKENEKKNEKKKDTARNLPFAFGPKTQGHFLASMGAVERTIQLIEDDSTTDEQAEELCTALERLMSKEEMGERFKVLAIAHKKDGIFAPAGF